MRAIQRSLSRRSRDYGPKLNDLMVSHFTKFFNLLLIKKFPIFVVKFC